MTDPTRQEIIDTLAELLNASNCDPKQPMTPEHVHRLAMAQARASGVVERLTGKSFIYES